MRRRRLLQGAAASLLSAAAPALPLPAIAQPARAAALRFIPQANLTVLDPGWTTATVTQNHGNYVFDVLYGCDSKLRPQPQMAAGHEVSADGRVWRIRLRDGLLFHDGSKVRAADCAASMARWAKQDPFGQLLARAVEAWVAADDATLEIRLTKPFPMLLDAIGGANSYTPVIMPEHLVRGAGDKPITEMIGSGPYRFVAAEYNSGSTMVYEKFDRYLPRSEPPDWGAGGKVAHFPRIEWHIIPDPATALAALQSGEMDWWERPQVDLQPVLAKDRNIVLEVSDPAGRLAFMRMNCLHPPFDDVRIRRAVAMGINQEDYMRASHGDDTSLWAVCRSLYPQHTPYYTDAGAETMKADLPRARAMLKEAGYGGQKALVINPTDYPDIGPLGEVSYALLKQIGVNVELQETDWGSVVQRRAKREPVEKGGWSMFHSTGGVASFANPAVSFLVRGQGETGWFGWWRNDEVEALTSQWLFTADPDEQRRIALRIGALALQDAASLPLGQYYLRTAYRRTITGVLQGQSPYPWSVRPV
jgi:peptide/nickel transport system substrate-binding protein